jgi:hypothetical protein
VRSGVPLDAVQADLVSSLDQLGEEQDDSEEGLYTHLDDDTRIARLESDRVFGAEDEPSHIAPENELVETRLMTDFRKRTYTARIVTLDDWSDDYNADLYEAHADENTEPFEPLDVTLIRLIEEEVRRRSSRMLGLATVEVIDVQTEAIKL